MVRISLFIIYFLLVVSSESKVLKSSAVAMGKAANCTQKPLILFGNYHTSSVYGQSMTNIEFDVLQPLNFPFHIIIQGKTSKEFCQQQADTYKNIIMQIRQNDCIIQNGCIWMNLITRKQEACQNFAKGRYNINNLNLKTGQDLRIGGRDSETKSIFCFVI